MKVRPALLLAVAVGGAVGAVLRYAAGELASDGSGFPWTTFTINVVGSFLLACLPALARARRSPTLAATLGPGLLGGFTTLSTYSEQTRTLLADGRTTIAGAYVLGTLAACVVAVLIASAWTTPTERLVLADDGGDE